MKGIDVTELSINHAVISASEMTNIVSGGALNSTHSLTPCRHVGGTFNVNIEWVKTRKYEKSYAKVFFRIPYLISYRPTTFCQHTKVYDITLLRRNITPLWRDNYFRRNYIT